MLFMWAKIGLLMTIKNENKAIEEKNALKKAEEKAKKEKAKNKDKNKK